MGLTLEVCVDSVESAIAAEQGGANRLELCSDLMDGGLTPSCGLVRAVKEAVTIPVYCMARPRGGDFCYSSHEIRTMQLDIAALKDAGADGIVLGCLTPEGAVDVDVTQSLVALSAPLPVTYHRAIDVSVDAGQAFDSVKQCGGARVLTSGCHKTAMDGIDVIARMVQRAGAEAGGPRVVVAGGVRGGNVEAIIHKVCALAMVCACSKCAGTAPFELHSSGGRVVVASQMKYRNTSVTMGHALLHEYEYDHLAASAEAVQGLRQSIDKACTAMTCRHRAAGPV